MSHSPIFDQLYTEFLNEHRCLPVRATMFYDSDHAEPVFDIPAVDETQEIQVVAEPVPSLVEKIHALHNEVVVEETDEEWAEAAIEPAETFEERVRRDLAKHAEAIANTPYSTVRFMDSDSAYQPIEIPAQEAMAWLKAAERPNPFMAMLADHQQKILFPPKMPTREMLGLEAKPAEEPETEPDAAPVVDEVQHVFPIVRGRHHRFTQMSVVTKLSEALQSVVFEHTTA